MDTKFLSFGTQKEAAFADEVDIPCASSVDTRGEGGRALNVANAKGAIWTLLAKMKLVAFRV